MTTSAASTCLTRTLRFHTFGEPSDVLILEEAHLPPPKPEQIRIRVAACGLTPADWALCRGLSPGDMPRGIGLEVSGEVDAVGDGVQGVGIGDEVLGVPDFQGYPSAGAADYAILNHWALAPAGLDMRVAAGLPMATETAFRTLECFGDIKDRNFLVHSAGTTVGFATVQLAIMRGARVFATAGETFADQLRGFGATVTLYGAGMVGRVRDLVGGAPDMILDVTPGGGSLPELIEIAGGDAGRILTITDPKAQELGVRLDHEMNLRYDVLGDFAKLAVEGRYVAPPIAGVFDLETWREALEISLSGHAHGKLILQPRVTPIAE